MITLYKYIPAWDSPDLSPFCIKVETYLRMSGLAYQTKMGNFRVAPKGKLPYIEHEGRLVCDSAAIIDYLEARADRPIDAGLSAKDQAAGVAWRSMLEEHLYFVNYWRRWGTEQGWAVTQPLIVQFMKQSGAAPGFLVRPLVALIRRKALKTIKGQGVGRHTPQEIMSIGVKLLKALADGLGDQPCILGHEPRTIDATAYAFLTSTLAAPIDDAVKDFVKSQHNLMAYQARMKTRYWS